MGYSLSAVKTGRFSFLYNLLTGVLGMKGVKYELEEVADLE